MKMGMFSCAFVLVMMFSVPKSFVCEAVTATCNMFLYERSDFIGTVNFTQQAPDQNVQMTVCVNDLTQGKHGFHVHEFGNLADTCAGAGSHFNPENKTHGDITDVERHVGDLGNLDIKTLGLQPCMPVDLQDSLISLFPGRHSIIGRVLAIHEKEDDLGRTSNPDSKTTGNSGKRVACCVIGLTSTMPSSSPSFSPFPALMSAFVALIIIFRMRVNTV